MGPLTDKELNELEALDRDATPVPWKWWTSNSHRRLGTPEKSDVVAYGFESRVDGVGSIAIAEADMKLIEVGRNQLPRLLAEVRELRKWREFCEGRVLAGLECVVLGGHHDILRDLHDRIVEGRIEEER